MVQTRSSTRNSLDSEDNNTNQENATQHPKHEDEPELSEVAKGKRPVKRYHSDDDSDPDEKKSKKRKRLPRGGQRKTHIFHIPIPNSRDLEIIREWFKRPLDRQCWGVIRDNFSALEGLWAEHYKWNLPTTRTEMDYALLVRTICEYRNMPSSNGRTCDRCAARGQTGCLHNGFDRCKGCVRNSVACTMTDKRTGETKVLLGNKYINEPLSDPDALVQWLTPDQHPPVPQLPGKKHRNDAGLDGPVRETRAATPGPSIQISQQGFVRRTRGNAAMTRSRQPRLPVKQQDPTVRLGNNSYTNNNFLNSPLYPDETSFGAQQGMAFAGQYQTHPEYPVPPESTAFNPHFPQHDQGDNGAGLHQQLAQLRNNNAMMINTILKLRGEVRRLGGDTSIGADAVGLQPIQRAPATLEGPAPFPARRQSQLGNATTASRSTTVTPISPLFENTLENITPTSSGFEYNTQHQTPASGFLDANVHQATPTSAGLEYNAEHQTTTSPLFNSTAHHSRPTSAPLLNSMSHQTPAQTLFPSELQDFELDSGYASFPSNLQQFGRQVPETPVDPGLLDYANEYSNLLQLDTGNTPNRSRLESYDVTGEATSALQQEGAMRRSRLSVTAGIEMGGNRAEAQEENRDLSLRSTKERLGEHVEEVLREEEQSASLDHLDAGWTGGPPVQFGRLNANSNGVQSGLDNESRHGSLAIDQFHGSLFGLSNDSDF